jgi:hypothetical protein
VEATSEERRRLYQFADYYAGWIAYWAKDTDLRPRKPRWMDRRDAKRIRDLTQRVVRTAINTH